MRSLRAICALTVGIGMMMALGGKLEAANKEAATDTPPALAFEMKTLGGKKVGLNEYAGDVVLMVNVASKCGYTPQYEQLQAIHEKYSSEGLSVLGFPCNQFGKQEPGTAEEIRDFCTSNYGVDFDMFAKVQVKGSEACPLYKHLTQLETKPKGSGDISWNFEKFLLDREGNVIGRFPSSTKPDDPALIKIIEAELARK